MTVVPAAYLVLKMGGVPWSAFVVYLLISAIAYITTLFIVLPQIHMDVKDYSLNVLRPCSLVLILSLITPFVMKQLTDSGIIYSLLTVAITVTSTGVLCYKIGIDKGMRIHIKKKMLSKIKKGSIEV